MNKLSIEIDQLRTVKHSVIPGTFTGKKRLRMYELEDKYFDCDIEWEILVAKREKGGGMKDVKGPKNRNLKCLALVFQVSRDATDATQSNQCCVLLMLLLLCIFITVNEKGIIVIH